MCAKMAFRVLRNPLISLRIVRCEFVSHTLRRNGILCRGTTGPPDRDAEHSRHDELTCWRMWRDNRRHRRRRMPSSYLSTQSYADPRHREPRDPGRRGRPMFLPRDSMDDIRFNDASSPDTIDHLNDERLRRSEEIARGWRRNWMIVLLVLLTAVGYWMLR